MGKKEGSGYDPSKSWAEIDADREKAAEQKMLARIANPNGASFAEDEKGREKAYNNETGWGTYSDPNT